MDAIRSHESEVREMATDDLCSELSLSDATALNDLYQPDARATTASPDAVRVQSGYSSLRQARNSSVWGFGVRLSRKEWYGATNGSGAATV